MVSVTLRSLRRWRKVCQNLEVKSTLPLRGGRGGGPGRGLRTTRHACASIRGGWAPSGCTTCDAPLRERVLRPLPGPPPRPPRSLGGLHFSCLLGEFREEFSRGGLLRRGFACPLDVEGF